MMDAAEAERCGLVSRVVPLAQLMDEAVAAAEKIAGMSLPATMVAKEAVNRAFETTLAEGVRFERRTFHATFAFDDRREGMAAFAESARPAGNTAESGCFGGVDRPPAGSYKRALRGTRNRWLITSRPRSAPARPSAAPP